MPDPTESELAGFTELSHVFNWAGIAGSFQAAFKKALGEPDFMRDVVHISRRSWDAAMGFKLPDSASSQQQPPPDLALSPVQEGRLESSHRACFLKCGVAIDTPSAGQGPQNGFRIGASDSSTTPPGMWPAATQGSSKKLKLSAVVDQTLEAEIQPRGSEAVKKLLDDYKAAHGAEPHPDMEPTEDQLAQRIVATLALQGLALCRLCLVWSLWQSDSSQARFCCLPLQPFYWEVAAESTTWAS